MSSSGYRDYFKVLGVERSASAASIKSAFRQLARKYHPDVNPGDSSSEARFKEISEAYEVLSDPDKRSKYEQYGEYWNHQQGAQSNGFDIDFGGYSNFDDFINELLGRFGSTTRAASGFSRRKTAQWDDSNQSLNLDAEVTLRVTFSEAFHGAGRTLSVNDERVQVKIPSGVRTGSKLRLKGKGNLQPGTGRRGDLYLVIDVSSHSVWRLVGDVLEADLPLSLDEIVLGGSITAITPDGEATVNIPSGTLPGTNLRLKEKGWPLNNIRGDLIFTIKLTFPGEWSPQELQHFRELKQIRCKDPRESWLKSARL